MNDDPSPRTSPSGDTALTGSASAEVSSQPTAQPAGANGAAGSNGKNHRRSIIRDMWRLMRRPRNGSASVRDTLEELAEQHDTADSPIDPTERLILENTLRLRSQTVEDVMVPRIDIAAVDVELSVPEVVERIGETLHSRLPVYQGDLDHVLGLIHVKDILPLAGLEDPPQLRSLMRSVMVVAPSMRVLDLLLQMQLERNHMALVVDEFGGIDGLVTIEDLVEQIVGDIEDEHEREEDLTMDPRPDGSLIADARVLLEDFEAEVGEVFTAEERENIDTLGGLVFNLVGRVPGRGEIVAHPSGIEFEILEGDPRRLKRLRIRNVRQLAVPSDAVA